MNGDQTIPILLDIQGKMGSMERKIGSLEGTVEAIHKRMDEFTSHCDTRSQELSERIRKNTSFRHYIKGGAAIFVLMIGYVAYSLNVLWEHIKQLIQQHHIS